MLKTFLFNLARDIKEEALDILFPIYCYGCGQAAGRVQPDFRRFLCPVCQSCLPECKTQICIACNKPSFSGLTHPKCKTSNLAERLFCVLDYQNPTVAKMIIEGKYFFIPKLFILLAELATEKLSRELRSYLVDNQFIVCPVPLHWTRLRWRGFNQSEIIAKLWAESFGLEMANLLKRKRVTKTQKNLVRGQRLDNLKDAFDPVSINAVKNRNILLVDDVATSGATLSSAAMALKSRGAGEICCIALARD
jgi:ComF family protein